MSRSVLDQKDVFCSHSPFRGGYVFCVVLYIVGLLTPALVVMTNWKVSRRCGQCGEGHLKKLKKSYEMKCLIMGTDSITCD